MITDETYSNFSNFSYISDNRVSYSSSQWLPPQSQDQHVPISTTTSYAHDVPKSLPTTQTTSSASQLGMKLNYFETWTNIDEE